MHSFQVMADPVRRRIVEILASGEHASGEITSVIAHDFGITRTAVARHLAILLGEDWVTVRADYTNRFYRLQPEAVCRRRWNGWSTSGSDASEPSSETTRSPITHSHSS